MLNVYPQAASLVPDDWQEVAEAVVLIPYHAISGSCRQCRSVTFDTGKALTALKKRPGSGVANNPAVTVKPMTLRINTIR